MRTGFRMRMIGLAVMGFVAAAGAQLSVTNGTFSDLAGLTSPGGDWRSGVPAGWTSSKSSPTYTVDVAKGSPPPVANLQTLSELSQNVGTLTNTCDVVLTFDFLNPWDRSGNRVSAVLLAGSSVIASNLFAASGSGLTLVATNVPSGSTVSVKFVDASTFAQPAAAPGLDNITAGAFAAGAPPTIIRQPAPKTAMLAGTTASLSVAALGVPPLAYQWYTNGVPLEGATNAALTATSWNTNYTVAVTAPNGVSVTSAVAQVISTVVNGDFSDLTGLTHTGGGWYAGVPLGWSVASSLYIINAAAGATPPLLNLDGKTLTQSLGTLTQVSDVVATFDMLQPFNGNACDVVAYLLNGSSVIASNRYTTSVQGSVVAATMAATNVPAGAAVSVKYVCRSGSPGLDNVRAEVFAPDAPPTLTQQPQAKNAMPPGTSATLSAGAVGVPPVRYQWLAGNAVIANATNAALTVTATNDYAVVVTAPNGVSATSAVAQVIGSVVNGDFSDVSGMVVQGVGWYQGMPAGWSSTDKPAGGLYAVAVDATGGPTAPVCNPSSLGHLQQKAGTLLKASNVILSFDLPFGFNDQTGASVRAAILNASTGQTLATGDFGVGDGRQLKAALVPRGTAIKIEFVSLFLTTAALDNVSVSIRQPGMSLMLR